MAQWEAFLKRNHKKRSSGSALPPALQTPPPSASASLEAGRLVLPPRSLPPPSEGRDRSGELEGVLRVGFREVSPPSIRREEEEGGGGDWAWLLQTRVIQLLPPFRGRE